MNRTDLQAISDLRVVEARALFSAGHLEGAYYLLGYAVECALEACIAKQIREHDFPDKRLVNDSYTHDLSKFLDLAGLEPELDRAANSRSALAVNWSVVKDWSEEARYQRGISQKAVTDFFSAVLEIPDGVLPWLPLRTRRRRMPRANFIGCILRLAAGTLLLACDDGPTPPGGDPRGLLLAVRGVGAAAEVYSMRPDGSERRQLTNNTVRDWDPDWSPDGRQVVFVSEQDSTPGAPRRRPEVFVMDADGSGMRRLHQSVGPAARPRWSPDGRQLAFTSNATGSFQIYVQDLTSGATSRITDDTTGYFVMSWRRRR